MCIRCCTMCLLLRVTSHQTPHSLHLLVQKQPHCNLVQGQLYLLVLQKTHLPPCLLQQTNGQRLSLHTSNRTEKIRQSAESQTFCVNLSNTCAMAVELASIAHARGVLASSESCRATGGCALTPHLKPVGLQSTKRMPLFAWLHEREYLLPYLHTGNSSRHIFRNYISSVHQAYSHVVSVFRNAVYHQVAWLEGTVSYLADSIGGIVLLVCWHQRSIRR